MWICQGGMLCSYLTVLFIDAKVYSIQFILCSAWCLLDRRNEIGRSRRKYHWNCINSDTSPPPPLPQDNHALHPVPTTLPLHLCTFKFEILWVVSFLSFPFFFFNLLLNNQGWFQQLPHIRSNLKQFCSCSLFGKGFLLRPVHCILMTSPWFWVRSQ